MKKSELILQKLDQVLTELSAIKRLAAVQGAAAQVANNPIPKLDIGNVANLSTLSVPALDRLQPLWPQPQPQSKIRAEIDAHDTEQTDAGTVHKFHFKIG